tara:strand:- start:138 stop:1301 length:1164 start_codon:yes stop_codon:yes gene_type:complete
MKAMGLVASSTTISLGTMAAVTENQSNRDANHDAALRSVHTSNFPDLLDQLGITLLVTTYQAGKLVMLRSDQGVLNTHFRMFDKPMGLAADADRIAIGTAMQVHEFHNIPAACNRLQSSRLHDACFLPRVTHHTGDIDVHEMAWVQDDLVFVNTRFSCLAKRSGTYNFVPVWRPSFINQNVPDDCCHLNGMAVCDGNVRYVTALGDSNKPSGWRANKKEGGILIDVQSNEIAARGLSMPHSPRWHDGKLWLLNSGSGSFGTIDLASGRYEPMVTLPGFIRGLSFYGPLAFIGLSQVRETAVFTEIPIADLPMEQRCCGVWVVNLQTANVIAFVKFEDAVQEIFAVEVLPGSRYPELVNEDRELMGNTYELPDTPLADDAGTGDSSPG